MKRVETKYARLPEQLVTFSQVAAILDIPDATLRKMHRGRIFDVHAGGNAGKRYLIPARYLPRIHRACKLKRGKLRRDFKDWKDICSAIGPFETDAEIAEIRASRNGQGLWRELRQPA